MGIHLYGESDTKVKMPADGGRLLLSPYMLVGVEGAIRSGIVQRDVQDLEPSLHLSLSEVRRSLVPLVGVLVVDRTVVRMRTLTTFDHE